MCVPDNFPHSILIVRSAFFALAVGVHIRVISDKCRKRVMTEKATKTKVRDFGPRANYTDRAAAACWRNSCNFADRGCREVSATDSHGH
jgi:hypothetical protein